MFETTFLTQADIRLVNSVMSDTESRVLLKIFEEGLWSYELASIITDFQIESVRSFLFVLASLKDKEKSKEAIFALMQLSLELGIDGDDPVNFFQLLSTDRKVHINEICKCIRRNNGRN